VLKIPEPGEAVATEDALEFQLDKASGR